MTTNQLKFWELRWKQHYEKLYVEEVTRSNKAKEAETSRHNRAQERIATQELVLKRQQLGLEWAKLEESIRSTMVKEVIDYENAKTNRYNARINAAKANTQAYEAVTNRIRTVNQLSIDLSKTELATAELWLQGVEAKTDAQIDAWGKAIDQAKDAFKLEGKMRLDPDFIFGDNEISVDATTDLGKLILNIANFGKDMSNTKEFDAVIQRIKEIAPKQIEMYGPTAGMHVDLNEIEELPKLDKHQLEGRAVERNVQRTIEGPTLVESNSPNGITSTTVNEDVKSLETKTPNGTAVIYSPGTRSGPGYSN